MFSFVLMMFIRLYFPIIMWFKGKMALGTIITGICQWYNFCFTIKTVAARLRSNTALFLNRGELSCSGWRPGIPICEDGN